jgi:soluble lytic murein transglycosylase-like protein
MIRTMSIIITFLVAVATAVGVVRQDESAALRQTASTYLTAEAAASHLAAATLAGELFSIDPTLLLSIAWHESRYAPDARTREPRGRWSCGVMTPVPHAEPCSAAELTMVGGYLAGAAHLGHWMRTCGGNETCALRGYAGGYRLIEKCRGDGTYFVRDGVDACNTNTMFTARARWIRTRLQRSS